MFQAGGARGVFPFRELFLPRSPDDSSPPACPLGVAPANWPFPVLGGEVRGHLGRIPRLVRQKPLIAYRAFVLVEIDPRHRIRISVSMTDLSLLGFCLLMV